MNANDKAKKNYFGRIINRYSRLASTTFKQHLWVKKPYLNTRKQGYHVKQIMKKVILKASPVDVNVWPPPRIHQIIDEAVDEYIDNDLP